MPRIGNPVGGARYKTTHVRESELQWRVEFLESRVAFLEAAILSDVIARAEAKFAPSNAEENAA